MITINNTSKLKSCDKCNKFEDLRIIEIRKENISPEEKEFIEHELYKIFEKYCKD